MSFWGCIFLVRLIKPSKMWATVLVCGAGGLHYASALVEHLKHNSFYFVPVFEISWPNLGLPT